MTANPPPFGPVNFATWSDYAKLDMRLSQYFKKSASGIILPMLFGFLPLTFCNGTKVAIAFSVFAVLSLVFTVVPLLFAGKMQLQAGGSQNQQNEQGNKPPSALARQYDEDEVDNYNRRRVKLLCSAAYASNIFLMCTAVCLAAVINKKYSALASPVLLVFFVLFGIFFECGRRNGFVWGAQQYESHHSDLKFFFDLSSEVTQTGFTGLSGSLLGNLKYVRCLQDNSFRPAEGLIMYAVVVGLFLMLVCTVPPALDFRNTREKVVSKFLKWTAYFLLVLISLAGLFAAATVVQTYIVFAMAVIIAVGAFWFYKVYSSEPSANDSPSRHVAGERSLMWLGIHSVMFGALMASYSSFLSGQHLSDLYKAAVFFIFAVLLTNFSRMVLVREVQDKGNEALVVLVSGFAIVLLMLLAVLLLILLAMLQPDQLRNTFRLV